MMRILSTVALLLIAITSLASAGETTPQQAMDKMMNCPVCSVWSQDPALGQTLRYSIAQTKTGYVETMSTADEKMKPAFDKCEAECAKRTNGMASMKQAEKDQLCPFCAGQMALRSHKDLSFENVNTPLGMVTVATGSSPEGIKALHEYAKKAQKQADLMAKASATMKPETLESKMH